MLSNENDRAFIEKIDRVLNAIPLKQFSLDDLLVEKKLSDDWITNDWITRNFRNEGYVMRIVSDSADMLTVKGLLFRANGGFAGEIERSEHEFNHVKRQAKFAKPAFWLTVATLALMLLQWLS